MSRSVDERVVELRFDSDQFQKGASNALDTIGRLNKGLQFDGANKSMGKLSSIFAKLNLGSFGDAIDSISNKFTMMGVIAATTIANITNKLVNMGMKIATAIPNQIIQGGIKRAMNIENAHFMLQGLLDTENQVQAVMDKASKSVDGTAYSYDSAAKAAAQFTASGLTAQQLVSPLRAITGVAAMTNAEYDDISQIFTTVAGNGRLMGDQLLQLSGRGLNAASTIADYFNKVKDGSIEANDDNAELIKSIKTLGGTAKTTEADIRDMVSKGKINFEIFSAAMDNAFGEHALKANETLTGAFSNVKAALSRIGAEFISPLIVQNGPLVKMLNSLRLLANEFKKNIAPFANTFVSVVTKIANAISKITGLVPELDKSLGHNGLSKSFKYKNWKAVEKVLLDISTLMKGFANIMNGVMRIAHQFGKAFFDIFPKPSIEGINNAISKFEQFTRIFEFKNFKTLQTIQNIFKGFFAVLDIGVQIVSALWNNITPLFKSFSSLGKTIFENAGSLGEWLTNLSKSWRETGYFNEKIGEAVKKVLEFKDKVIDLWNAFKGGFAKSTGIDLHIPSWQELLKIFDKIKEKLKPLTDLFGTIKTKLDELNKAAAKYINLENLVKVLTTLGEIAGAIGKVIGSTFATLANSIGYFGTTLVSSLDQFSGVMGTAGGLTAIAGEGGLFAGLIILMKNLNSTVRTFKGSLSVFSKIAGVLGQLKNVLVTWQNQLRSQELLNIAIAVGILAASIMVLASVDEDAAVKAVVIVSHLMGTLFGFMKFTESFIKSSTPFNNSLNMIGTAMIKMGVAVLLLAVAMKVLDSVSWSGIAKGLIVMTTALGALAGAAMALRSIKADKALKKLSKSLVPLGTAMILLAVAFRIFNKVEPSAVAKGLTVMVVALASLAGAAMAIQAVKANSAMLALSVALMALGQAMILLASAFAIFNFVKPEAFAKGLTVMVVAIASLAGAAMAIQALNAGPALLALSLALTTLANAMIVLSAAFLLFGLVSEEGLFNGLVVMISAISALTVAASFISGTGATGSLLALSGALAILSVAMMQFAIAMKIFDSVSIGGIAKGLIVFAIALGALVAVAVFLGEFIPAMIGVAAAMLMVGVAVAAIGVGFLAIAVAINIFIASLILLAGISAATAASIVTAFQIIVIGVIELLPNIARAIVDFFTALLVTIAKSMGDIVSSAVTIVNGILDILLQTLPKLLELIWELTKGIIKLIIKASPLIADAIIQILKDTIRGIKEIVPELTEALWEILLAFQEQATEYLPDIVELFMQMITDILEGIANKIDDIVNAAYDIVIAFMDAIGEKVPDVVEAGIEMVINFIEGTAQAIEDHTEEMKQAIEHLINAMLDMGIAVIEGMINPFAERGKALMESGFVKGIKEKIDLIKEKIREGLDKAISKAREFINKFKAIGQSIMNSGLVQGIKQHVSAIWDKIKGGVQGALDKLKGFVDKFKNVGIEMMNGLANGLKPDKVIQKVANVGNEALAKIKAILGIASPSKEFAWVGRMAMEGLIVGIDKMSGKVNDETSQIGSSMLEELGKALQYATDELNNYDFNPTIRPVVDMSDVWSAEGDISNIFSSRGIDARVSDISARIDGINGIDKLGNNLSDISNLNNKKLLEAMDKQNKAFEDMSNRLDKMQVVLDSGELVGGISSKMDNALGSRAVYAGRMNA